MIKKWRWITTLALFLLVAWLVPASAKAQVCGSKIAWKYELEFIQKARERVKAPNHPSTVSRITCGTGLIDAIGKPVLTPPCPECAKEYVGLLLDVIAYTRFAAEKSASNQGKLKYYESEIATRLTLGQFLLDTRDTQLIDDYWSRNFEGLGDAMERSKLGQRFHEEASKAAATRQLSLKSYETWARAVRSCEAWDFQGQNRDLKKLRSILNCVEDCSRALERIQRRAKQGERPDREILEEQLGDLLPPSGQCPAGDMP